MLDAPRGGTAAFCRRDGGTARLRRPGARRRRCRRASLPEWNKRNSGQAEGKACVTISEGCGSAPRSRGCAAAPALAQEETIKVGVLHSLSGTMAISETTLKDVMLMLIEEQNAKGGVLGRQLEAVVVDPASDWPRFAELSRELIAGPGGRRGVRLLDQRQPQVGAAGVRGAELGAVLPGAVRGAGEPAQRLLHRRGAEPAGDPGGRLPDERGGGRALGARRHRLRLSADDEPDPRGLPEGERRRRRGHHDQLHAVRAFRLADDRLRRQGLRLAGQEDGGGVDDQRRRQRAVLQGARQPGHLGRGHPRRRLLGRRGGARRASTPRRWSATWRPGTTSRASTRPRTPRSSRSGRRSPATRSAPPTTRWRRTTSASTCG